ncbi:MAG: hypothetical protein IJM64_02845 [Ottowia sp.]|nr:hypothetical protein [Ottowia sp.]
MPNMDEETKTRRWPFIIQLPSLCLAPITVFGLSHPMAEQMKALGALGYFLIFFFAFPAGLIALIYMKRHAAALAEAEGDFASIARREADAAAGRFTLAGTAKTGGLLYVRCFFDKEVANIARITAPDGWQAGFDAAVRAVESSFKPGF